MSSCSGCSLCVTSSQVKSARQRRVSVGYGRRRHRRRLRRSLNLGCSRGTRRAKRRRTSPANRLGTAGARPTEPAPAPKRASLYTGNTYFRYPQLKWPGMFRPFEAYDLHLDAGGRTHPGRAIRIHGDRARRLTIETKSQRPRGAGRLSPTDRNEGANRPSSESAPNEARN